MFSTRVVSSRALSRVLRQLTCPTARRQYATDYEQRTKDTLKTSSRLTWSVVKSFTRPTALIISRLTTAAAAGAAALYYTTSSSSSSSSTEATSSSSSNTSTTSSSSASSPDLKPGHRHESAYASDVPKPVEDRHGDTVTKHSIAARKNQERIRVGKFSGEEFDNHELEHTPGEPGGDFERKK